MDSVAAAASATTIIISVGFVRFYLQLCLIRCYALRENFCSHKDGNNGRRLTASAMAIIRLTTDVGLFGFPPRTGKIGNMSPASEASVKQRRQTFSRCMFSCPPDIT
uniref:Uncharacterized protein n=1 Tax=Anopheles coluzzii TaxID=1518534 RepID=A0A8W7P1S4_ANOCL